jgi:putative phosphoribosyl transferase
MKGLARWRDRRRYLFTDRIDAGEKLAGRLRAGPGTLVLGLPRGGVPVAAEVARTLGAGLDVLVARKVGAPRQPELALGAVTADGTLYLDTGLIRHLRVPDATLDDAIAREREIARDRERRFRAGHPAAPMANRTVILVDDGLATGATMMAAARAARRHGPARLVVAAPVGSVSAVAALAAAADEVVCLHTPEPFRAVGEFYEDFAPTTDAEVEAILARFRDPA